MAEEAALAAMIALAASRSTPMGLDMSPAFIISLAPHCYCALFSHFSMEWENKRTSCEDDILCHRFLQYLGGFCRAHGLQIADANF